MTLSNTIVSGFGTSDNISTMLTTENNLLKMDLSNTFNIINNANVSKLYGKKATLMNWDIFVEAGSWVIRYSVGSNGASAGLTIKHPYQMLQMI